VADDEAGAPTTPADNFTPAQIRLLKIAVVGMGIVIVLALIAILARIFYLATARTPQVSHNLSQIPADARLGLPAGAAIRAISVSGDRLAVHYEGPAGSGIAILDLASGKPASRITIVPEVGR